MVLHTSYISVHAAMQSLMAVDVSYKGFRCPAMTVEPVESSGGQDWVLRLGKGNACPVKHHESTRPAVFMNGSRRTCAVALLNAAHVNMQLNITPIQPASQTQTSRLSSQLQLQTSSKVSVGTLKR